MTVTSFNDLFIFELSDIYNAEKQLLKALPKMAEAATDAKLKEAFKSHLRETEGQVERIERAVQAEALELKRETCEAMKGLIKEGEEAIDEIEAGPLLDAALIVAAQKVEHYEIAGYGSLIELAKTLGYKRAVELLSETLAEEKGADEKLNTIALTAVNQTAALETGNKTGARV